MLKVRQPGREDPSFSRIVAQLSFPRRCDQLLDRPDMKITCRGSKMSTTRKAGESFCSFAMIPSSPHFNSYLSTLQRPRFYLYSSLEILQKPGRRYLLKQCKVRCGYRLLKSALARKGTYKPDKKSRCTAHEPCYWLEVEGMP
jgi:hypothetical protein